MTLNDIEIGSLVKAARGEMSQANLARAMHGAGFKWSQPTTVAIEKGERPLKLSEVVVLCEILGVSPERFVAEASVSATARRRRELEAARRNFKLASERLAQAEGKPQGPVTVI